MQTKREVCLYNLEQLALIIKSESDVAYYNQAGGYACLKPSSEGILILIDDEMRAILKGLSFIIINKPRLTDKDADQIDDILNSNTGSKGLIVDRNKLEDSMEAWVHVLINYQNANFDIKGFKEVEGILTWNNSD